MTRDAWVARHPYLQPVADLRASVESAAARVVTPVERVPDWQDYLGDFHGGIPLLWSGHTELDVSDGPAVVLGMLGELMRAMPPVWLADQCRALQADLEVRPDSPANVALFRCLLWAVLAAELKLVITAFTSWRDEERWLRNYCPVCGTPPAMAQLVNRTEGRLRLLSCGCCGTRWRYRRTGCPFCEHADDHTLAVVGIQGEGGLRIDYCHRCHGYLKTYDGEGSESVLLADWTSLHLDLLARDRGLKRLASSLYEV